MRMTLYRMHSSSLSTGFRACEPACSGGGSFQDWQQRLDELRGSLSTDGNSLSKSYFDIEMADLTAENPSTPPRSRLRGKRSPPMSIATSLLPQVSLIADECELLTVTNGVRAALKRSTIPPTPNMKSLADMLTKMPVAELSQQLMIELDDIARSRFDKLVDEVTKAEGFMVGEPLFEKIKGKTKCLQYKWEERFNE